MDWQIEQSEVCMNSTYDIPLSWICRTPSDRPCVRLCRFRNNPLVVNQPHIRFYAGAPLVTEDSRIRLGSLCVIDLKPRQFDAESCTVLANFAEVVVREIEKEKMRVIVVCTPRLLSAHDVDNGGKSECLFLYLFQCAR